MAGLSYAFDPSAGETPQSIAQRRQLADAIAARIFGNAPKNVGEGLNAIGQALIARTMRDETDAAQKAGQATIPAWLGGTGAAATAPATVPSVATPPAVSAAPMGNIPAPTNATTKIYSNDEPSPLDPPSGDDRNAMIATVLGEAGNQGATGMNAVASVIRNRAVNGGFGGDTPLQVVTAKNQFEPWNTPQGRANMATAMQNPQQVAAANAAIESAYAGNDPTNGATMFYSPSAQAALGRPTPSWAQGPGQDIGAHRFFGGAPQVAPQVAQAVQDDSGNAALPPTAQPTQGALPTAQAVQAASQPKSYGGPFPNVSTADLTRQAFNPWLPQTTRQVLNAEITRRAQADQQANDPLRQLQIKQVQQNLDKPDETFGVVGKDPATGNPQYGWINNKTRQVTPYVNPQAQNGTTGDFEAALKSGVTGNDLYAYIPQDQVNTVKGMVEGRIPPPNATARSSPRTLQLLNYASAIDPSFDATTWKARSTFNQQFGSQAPSSIGGQKVLMSTALGHLAEVANSAAELNNSDGFGYAPAGHWMNYAKNQTTSNAAIANAMEDKVAKFSGEVGKLYSGSQGGGVHEREDTRNRLGSTLTSAELAAGLEASKDLILSKQKALEDQASQIFGPERAQRFDFVGPEGRDAIAKIDKAIMMLRGKTPQGPANTASTVDPAALAEARRRGLIP